MNKQKANTRLERGPIDVSEYLPGTKIVFTPGDLFTVKRTSDKGTMVFLDCAIIISHQIRIVMTHNDIRIMASGIHVSSNFIENGKTMPLLTRIKIGATDELIIIDNNSKFLGNITDESFNDDIPFTTSIQIPDYIKEVTTREFRNKIKSIRLLEETEFPWI